MKTFCRRNKLLLSADLRPTLALTKISRVCHAPSASLLFAVGDRRERQSERGPPTAPMRLTRSLRAGNREVNNLRSFGFPFRPRFVSSRHEFFGFVSPAIKSGIVTISGPVKEFLVESNKEGGAGVGKLSQSLSSSGKVKTEANQPLPLLSFSMTLSQSV